MRKLHIVATLVLGVSIAALAQEASPSQSSSAARVVDLREVQTLVYTQQAL